MLPTANDHHFVFIKGETTTTKPHNKKTMQRDVKFFLAVILVFMIIYIINKSSSRITVMPKSTMINIFSKVIMFQLYLFLQ